MFRILRRNEVLRNITQIGNVQTRTLTEKHRMLYNNYESIYVADKKSIHLLKDYWHGIKQIGIIGWGSQGPAQAQNIRDSLHKIQLDIPIKIGLRPGSSSIKESQKLGFEVDNIENVLGTSDLNLLLTSDASQAENYKYFFPV